MSARKTERPVMLSIGNSPGTIEAAAAALERVLKAATQEGAQVAAAHALAEIARAPSHSTVTNCHFEAKS